MRKILSIILVLQDKRVAKTTPRVKNITTLRRINPYNPLSYAVLIIIIFVGFILYGVVGFWKETDKSNPFKWS